MSSSFTIPCPHCGNVSTFRTGIAKNGSGVGTCRNCHKSVRIQVDSQGNIKNVS
jgi:transcription elongation factor Elf1